MRGSLLLEQGTGKQKGTEVTGQLTNVCIVTNSDDFNSGENREDRSRGL